MKVSGPAVTVTLALALLAPPLAAEVQAAPEEAFWWVRMIPQRPVVAAAQQWWHYVQEGLFALEMRGRRQSDMQRWESAAEKAFRAAVEEARRFGPESEYLPFSLILLGGVHHLQGKLADAEPLYRQALAIYERAFGAEHRNVADALYGLGGLYLNQGRLQDAELLLKRALTIQEKILGPDNPAVAMTLYTYAKLLRQRGRTDEAQEMDPEEGWARAKKDIQELSFAVLRFEAHIRALPGALEELTKPVTNPEGKQVGPFLPRLPNPPRGCGAYRYERISGGQDRFRIFTSMYGQVLEDRR